MATSHRSSTFGLVLVFCCASFVAACGGGRHHAANGPHDVPNTTETRAAPANRTNANSGSVADERRDDARDKKKENATRWEKLGERIVDGRADKDMIPVGRDDGKFGDIQLKVEGSALELFDVVVTFGDGTTFSPGTRLAFANGATTRVIDLPGGKRVIKKVDFKYGNLPGGGRAQIELWAR